MAREKTYFVYIVTNPGLTTLYTGVTNNLIARLSEHWENRGTRGTFAGKYYCYNLIYFEEHDSIIAAIAREKEIKNWNRSKKEDLIRSKNPDWISLNEKVCGTWPPTKIKTR